jgi:hypothetical protein
MSIFDTIQTAIKDAETKRDNLSKVQEEANRIIAEQQDKVNQAGRESSEANEKVRTLRLELDKQLDEASGPRRDNVKVF